MGTSSHGAVLLNWGCFGSLRDIWQTLETLLVVTTGGEGTGQKVVKPPSVHRTAPQPRE